MHYTDLEAREREWSGPVPVTTPLRTLEDAARDALDAKWLSQATEQGEAQTLCATRRDASCSARRKQAAP